MRIDRVELTAAPAGVLGAADSIEGRIASRPIAVGEPLRRDILRAPNVVQAGDLVRVRAGGPGFSITTDGKALGAAAEGQAMQVSVAGKVLSGVARANRIVEVR